MVSRAVIDDFVAQKRLALVGVSRSGKGFGEIARKELTARGYQLRLVHPEVDELRGTPCVRSLGELSGQVEGVLLVTPPSATLELVKEAAAAGIQRVWMQQGAESDEAIQYCESHGISVISKQCVIMFAQPRAFPHNFHYWIMDVLGRLPASPKALPPAA